MPLCDSLGCAILPKSSVHNFKMLYMNFALKIYRVAESHGTFGNEGGDDCASVRDRMLF